MSRRIRIFFLLNYESESERKSPGFYLFRKQGLLLRLVRPTWSLRKQMRKIIWGNFSITKANAKTNLQICFCNIFVQMVTLLKRTSTSREGTSFAKSKVANLEHRLPKQGGKSELRSSANDVRSSATLRQLLRKPCRILLVNCLGLCIFASKNRFNVLGVDQCWLHWPSAWCRIEVLLGHYANATPCLLSLLWKSGAAQSVTPSQRTLPPPCWLQEKALSVAYTTRWSNCCLAALAHLQHGSFSSAVL